MSENLRLVALLLLFGCVDGGVDEHGEPGLPRANGTISASPGLDLTAFTKLELRFGPADPAGALATFRQSHALSSTVLPFSYSIGGDLGVNQYSHWNLTAWLTNAGSSSDQPIAGEPAATTLLGFDCTQGCPTQSGINLVLD